MVITDKVRSILANYESDCPGTKANLARILMQGRLGGSGKLIILPVDQGWEHGPARSHAPNPAGYDPHYFPQLALDAGMSAYAAPLGAIEAIADTYAGQIPLILKVNSANSLAPNNIDYNQAITGSVMDAIRLGCSAIGFTIYPGSENAYEMIEEIRDMAEEAKALGLVVIIWSYSRGGFLTKEGQTAIDIAGYAAHMAAQLGAHIIKVKLPSDHLELDAAKKVYEEYEIPVATPAERVAHVMQCAFNSRRMVVFSGGAAKGADQVFEDARAIRDGGGNGSIIGRNSFQRTKEDALEMLDRIIKIYLDEE
jgi:class I fructose-bisphosphate aldolase